MNIGLIMGCFVEAVINRINILRKFLFANLNRCFETEASIQTCYPGYLLKDNPEKTLGSCQTALNSQWLITYLRAGPNYTSKIALLKKSSSKDVHFGIS